MSKKHRYIAFILIAVIFSFSVLNSMCLDGHLKHNCLGNNCPICQIVKINNRLLDDVVVYNIIPIFISFILISISKKYYEYNEIKFSLVKYKVRLNN